MPSFVSWCDRDLKGREKVWRLEYSVYWLPSPLRSVTLLAYADGTRICLNGILLMGVKRYRAQIFLGCYEAVVCRAADRLKWRGWTGLDSWANVGDLRLSVRRCRTKRFLGLNFNFNAPHTYLCNIYPFIPTTTTLRSAIYTYIVSI
jgi:hypothetical protein